MAAALAATGASIVVGTALVEMVTARFGGGGGIVGGGNVTGATAGFVASVDGTGAGDGSNGGKVLGIDTVGVVSNGGKAAGGVVGTVIVGDRAAAATNGE